MNGQCHIQTLYIYIYFEYKGKRKGMSCSTKEDLCSTAPEVNADDPFLEAFKPWRVQCLV